MSFQDLSSSAKTANLELQKVLLKGISINLKTQSYYIGGLILNKQINMFKTKDNRNQRGPDEVNGIWLSIAI